MDVEEENERKATVGFEVTLHYLSVNVYIYILRRR